MATPLTAVEHVLIDMDGVVVRGRAPIAGTAEAFATFRHSGVRFAILTNNSTRTAESYAEMLAELGVEVNPDEVITSSRATAAYLEGLTSGDPGGDGRTVYAIGEEGLLTYLRRAGFTITEDAPKYVVVGLDRDFSYEKLRCAQRGVFGGARLIATNPDTTYPGEHEIVPGCGSLVAAVEAASGVKATVIGKPFPAMFASAMAAIGASPATTVMVGDRLDTDIGGAAEIGLTTALVLTGVTDAAMLETSTIRPNYTFPNLLAFAQALADVRRGSG